MSGTATNHVPRDGQSPDDEPGGAALTRYDVTLATIPLLFALAFFAALLIEIAVPTALAAASTVGLGLIVDNAFRNPPVPRR